ncbi:MAG: S16 family serine protease [Candidatus Pacearchaeota archaeon]
MKTFAKKENKKTEAFFIILLVGIAIITLLLFFSFYFYPETEKISTNEKQEEAMPITKPIIYSNLSFENTIVKSMLVPAVDKDGRGVITEIVVEVVNGSGRVLVDINNLLFWADTQESIRKAREVAQNYTGVNISDYDLIYHIYANANVVGGPSAGAALAAITIAALQNKTLANDTTISGVINYDGTIGPISEIYAKAKVSKKNNITTLLVPLGQSREITYDEREACRTYGNVEYCTRERIPKIINLSEELGMNVIEVDNINEAMNYLYQ